MHIRLQKWDFIGQEKDVTDKHAKSSQWAEGKEIRNQTFRRNAMKLFSKFVPVSIDQWKAWAACSHTDSRNLHTQFYCRAQTRGIDVGQQKISA